MKKYRGYYIDGVIFHSESEIDAFIKKQAIEHYKMLCAMFANKPSIELSVMMCDKADYLHNVLGLSYAEIEDIEIEAIKAA